MALNSKLILSQFWSLEIHNWYRLSPKTLVKVGNPFLSSCSFWWLYAFYDLQQFMPVFPITFSDTSIISSNFSLRKMLKIVPRGHLDIQRCLPILGYFIPPAKSSIKTVCKFQGLRHGYIWGSDFFFFLDYCRSQRWLPGFLLFGMMVSLSWAREFKNEEYIWRSDD